MCFFKALAHIGLDLGCIEMTLYIEKTTGNTSVSLGTKREKNKRPS